MCSRGQSTCAAGVRARVSLAGITITVVFIIKKNFCFPFEICVSRRVKPIRMVARFSLFILRIWNVQSHSQGSLSLSSLVTRLKIFMNV